jgi:hypothetical protein
VCTLLYLPLDDEPFSAALGLNRDEEYARPAAPPRWWPAVDADVGFVAPVDLRAGGTWFGLAETGLFVALTNGRQPFPFRHVRSRGDLVSASLRLGSLDAAVAALVEHDALAYAPCHLFLAQGDRAAYVAPDAGGRFVAQPLARRPHTLTNAGLDKGDTPPLPATNTMPPDDNLTRLRSALATHDSPTARCRHGADRGTRSSALLLLGPTLATSRLLYAEGPPCVTDFHEVPLAIGRETSMQPS